MRTAAGSSETTQKHSESMDQATETILSQFPTRSFTNMLSSSNNILPAPTVISTVRLTLVSRGVAGPCARIYRLPSPASAQQEDSDVSRSFASTYEAWVALLPPNLHTKPLPNPKAKDLQNRGRIPLNTPLPQRVRLLAESLLQRPPLTYPSEEKGTAEYPLVPSEEDLIGFVTTGQFNLAEGKGVAIGAVSVAKALEGINTSRKRGAKEMRLCIIRNAGEKIGRLAKWEPV